MIASKALTVFQRATTLLMILSSMFVHAHAHPLNATRGPLVPNHAPLNDSSHLPYRGLDPVWKPRVEESPALVQEGSLRREEMTSVNLRVRPPDIPRGQPVQTDAPRINLSNPKTRVCSKQGFHSNRTQMQERSLQQEHTESVATPTPPPLPKTLEEVPEYRRLQQLYEEKLQEPKKQSPVSGLAVALEVASTSPLILSIKVTNNNTVPITFMDFGTPFAGSVLTLGFLKIETSSRRLFYDKVLAKPGISPKISEEELRSTLSEIGPGQSKEKELVVKDALRTKFHEEYEKHLGKEVDIWLSGKWHFVWTSTQDEVVEQMRGESGFRMISGRHTGGYRSNTINATIS